MTELFLFLTPLILLPIVLLLAFVGCQQILEIKQGNTTIRFIYAAGLNDELEKIEWEFIMNLEPGDGEIGSGYGDLNPPYHSPHYEVFGNGINPSETEAPDGALQASSEGFVTCRCWIKPIGGERIELPEIFKPKYEGQPAPFFKLQRSGSDYQVV